MQYKFWTLSTYDGEVNIVATYHDATSLVLELKTLRRESPGFKFLPNIIDIQDDTNDFEFGHTYKSDNHFVNITTHFFKVELEKTFTTINPEG